MTVRNLLLEQLAAVYDENSWFVCYNVAIEALTDYEVHTRTDEGQENTIAEIINHLYFYNSRYLSRFRGEEVKTYPSYYNTFQCHEGMKWSETSHQVQETFEGFRQSIRYCSDEKLVRWCEALTHIWLHNAYHIGQIVHIRKQFGSWRSSPVVRG
ncbi:hypothetical protein EQV77_10055 [Halobacillus fulvus]|nr:hypothetical protein EQV77_10055 [Halobacillus fulvus]